MSGTAPRLLADTAAPLQLGTPDAGVRVEAAAGQMFGPRGACQFGTDGPLWVADTGHHRLLGWSRPRADAGPDLWLGQAGLDGEAANRGGAAGRRTLNMPTAICAVGTGMAVADSWNHRVLIWDALPRHHRSPPDRVLGQPDFDSGAANRGQAEPGANTLFWPSGVHCDGTRLYVADAGNRRVLVWDHLPEHNGEAANRVLGQTTMRCRDQNGGTDLDAGGLVWPHSVIVWQGRLVVADAGANRVLLWTQPLTRAGQAADIVLGQETVEDRVHNRGNAFPDAGSLAMPYAVAAIEDWLIVADTANSRLLGWHADTLASGVRAQRVHGQTGFNSAGDNRWQTAAQDSLCWPYGLHALGKSLIIADTGNNRVQRWTLPAGIGLRVPDASS